jgi:bacillopeptidase F (M6 metalloprotease family)
MRHCRTTVRDMSEQPALCVACDCVDDELHYTAAGAGPFCGECWVSLNDPDQALLAEKRLEMTEQRVEELLSLLTRATSALEERHAVDGGNHGDEPCDICRLILALWRAAGETL